MVKKSKKTPKFFFAWQSRKFKRNFKFKSNRSLFNYKPRMRIFFRRVFSNIFITLTDLRNKVVYSLSAGMCTDKNNKRGKTAPFIIEAMTDKIIKILQRFRIYYLEIIIKSFVRVHLRIFVNRLLQANCKVISILDKRIAPHNGVRGKALKRR